MPFTPTPMPGYKASIQYTTTPSVVMSNEAMTTPDNNVYTIANLAHRFWDFAVTPVVQTGLPSVQTVTMTGSPTGGNFTMTLGAQTTGTIPWNATAAQMQAALVLLSNINAGGVLVTGGPFPSTPLVVTFQAPNAPGPKATFSATSGGLTGGVTPTATPVSTQVGVAYATISATLYAIQFLGGVVDFVVTLTGLSPMTQVLSGNYFTASYLGQADTADLSFDMGMEDTTSMSTTGTPSPFKTFIASLQGFSIKLHRFFLDTTFFTTYLNVGGTGAVLVAISVYLGEDATMRFDGYYWLKQDDIKTPVAKTVDESLDLQGTGVFAFYA